MMRKTPLRGRGPVSAWWRRLIGGCAALCAIPVLVALPLSATPRMAAGAALARSSARGAGRLRSAVRLGVLCPVPAGGAVPSRPDGAAPRPVMAVVGASFTAGVGAKNPSQGWASLLARQLGWRAVVRGVPGAGYVRKGEHDGGPIARELREVDLPRLEPALVIIQAGHNDIGAPLAEVADQVSLDVRMVRQEDPRARLVLITVFLRGNKVSSAAQATDRTIVAAAHKADPAALVLDPLHPRWRFPRVADQLHPDEAGHESIAYRVARALTAAGVRTYRPSPCGPPVPAASSAA